MAGRGDVGAVGHAGGSRGAAGGARRWLVAGALAGAALGCGGCGTAPRAAVPDEQGERAAGRGPTQTDETDETDEASAGGEGLHGGSLSSRSSSSPSSPSPPAASFPPRPPPAPPFLHAPPGSLDPFYAGLAAARARSPSDGRVLVSIFGDSHTAGDRMTARLRQVLAGRFGDAGRGLVAMGKPAARHYYQTEVRYGSTGKWKAAVGGHKEDAEPFGMAGLRTWTRDRRAQSWVESCAECPVAGRVGRFELFYWVHPGGAKLRYRVDQHKWQTVPTALRGGGAAHPARTVIPVPDGPHRLTVEPAGSGTLALFGVALERERPGVVIDGLGVVGRTVLQLAAWDWAVIGAQLAERAPRLVILQYGTNEADNPDLDLGALARRYEQVIARVRTAAPGAAILLLGPPDMAVREAGKSCDDPKRGVPPFVAPLPPEAPLAEPPSGPILDPVTGVAIDPSAPWVDPACRWRTPQRLLDVVAVQREVARKERVAFFDSLAALGGAETIDAMVLAVPPLAYKDRVHLTAAGYGRWADLLLAELLAGYDAFTASPLGPAAPAAGPIAPTSPAAPAPAAAPVEP